MLTTWFIPKLKEVTGDDFDEQWFMQDGIQLITVIIINRSNIVIVTDKLMVAW